MAIYGVSGSELAAVYGSAGTALSEAFNVSGTKVYETGGSGGDHRDWSEMRTSFKTALDSALTYTESYLGEHQTAFAFPVFTDVHTYFSWNEPNYVAYNYPDTFPVFLFLGDMTQTYNLLQLNNSVYYMQGADGQTNLVSIGNHEWGAYDVDSGDPYPRDWYTPLLPSSCVSFDDDGMTYYYDDVANNVRYIMLDSNSTVKKQSGVQKFNMDALNWFATVMESAGSKDIIVMNHAMGSGFYLVTDTEKANWQSDTAITNIGTMNNIINAFIGRSTVNVTVDGTANAHDFSENTGTFIGYFTGHFHNAGYTDNYGYNKFTCPALIKNNLTNKGMSIFIIDKASEKIIWLVIRVLNDEYERYEYEI